MFIGLCLALTWCGDEITILTTSYIVDESGNHLVDESGNDIIGVWLS